MTSLGFQVLSPSMIKRLWCILKGFLSSAVVNNLPVSAGDIRVLSFIPGLGRSPGGGNGNPLQYSCLRNPRDRGAWWATVHRVVESDTTEQLRTSFTYCFNLVVSESSHASLGLLSLDIQIFSFFQQSLLKLLSPMYFSLSQGRGTPHVFGGPCLSACVYLFMSGTYQPWLTM